MIIAMNFVKPLNNFDLLKKKKTLLNPHMWIGTREDRVQRKSTCGLTNAASQLVNKEKYEKLANSKRTTERVATLKYTLACT